MDGEGAAAGHELRQPSRPLRLGRHRRRRLRSRSPSPSATSRRRSIGSHLHKLAYPGGFQGVRQRRARAARGRPPSAGNVLDVQVRGEYAYAALGEGGFRVYDIANIDNKDFSRAHRHRAGVAARTAAVRQDQERRRCRDAHDARRRSAAYAQAGERGAEDPSDVRLPLRRRHGRGLILVGAATLLDGNPANNFLTRAVTFNPNGVLTGARRVVLAGHYAYVLTPRGLVVVDVNDADRANDYGRDRRTAS